MAAWKQAAIAFSLFFAASACAVVLPFYPAPKLTPFYQITKLLDFAALFVYYGGSVKQIPRRHTQ